MVGRRAAGRVRARAPAHVPGDPTSAPAYDGGRDPTAAAGPADRCRPPRGPRPMTTTPALREGVDKLPGTLSTYSRGMSPCRLVDRPTDRLKSRSLARNPVAQGIDR